MFMHKDSYVCPLNYEVDEISPVFLGVLEKATNTLFPPFLDIWCIVFGTEIKKCTLRASYTNFGQDYPWIIA
jgi:hypothetical protein